MQLVNGGVTRATLVHKPTYWIIRHGDYPEVCLEGSFGTEGHWTFKFGLAACHCVDALVIKIRVRGATIQRKLVRFREGSEETWLDLGKVQCWCPYFCRVYDAPFIFPRRELICIFYFQAGDFVQHFVDPGDISR